MGLGALIASSIAVDQTARNVDSLKTARSDELVICTLGAGGDIIGIAAIAIISQVVMIILRFLNVCNRKIKVFFLVVSVNSCMHIWAPGVVNRRKYLYCTTLPKASLYKFQTCFDGYEKRHVSKIIH